MTVYHIDSEKNKKQIGICSTIEEAIGLIVTDNKKKFVSLRGRIAPLDKGNYYSILVNDRIINYIVEK